jgi:dTDP-4-dehydrorhamnose reductase
MEILILGGAGMLGHKLFQHLRKRHPDTYCTIRGARKDAPLSKIDLFREGGVIENIDVLDFAALEQLLLQEAPRVVINCVGVVKQREAAKQPVPSIRINALLPHQLAAACERFGGRLIHFSTDCVFSGKLGNYREGDISDAEDLYGRTKFLGEVSAGRAITLRTSIVGRELVHRAGLLEWLLAQNHRRVAGYTHAMFSGVTTNHMAKVVESLIEDHPGLAGLHQVTAQTVSKCELLCLLRDAYGLDIEITPDALFYCDRSMKGDKFTEATGRARPAWPELAAELANDDTPYQAWKQEPVSRI